mmetsp:Transcript_9867/g.23075  ORF Transcript_9867/g.23075 Transcript_9867/m.23075 type:complete len:294 (-) Transcript_9867:1078-1959(-)
MGNSCRGQRQRNCRVGHERRDVRGDGRRIAPENTPVVVCEEGFEFHALIDSGGFGFVFKATRRTTGKDYALKVQPKEFLSRLTRQRPEALLTEKTTLCACRGHPFIVTLEYSFTTKLYAVLALEYVPGGTLSRLVTHSPLGRLPSGLARLYAAEIAVALNFVHGRGIVFRDVKPSNVLLASNGHIKLTDFGLAGSLLARKRLVNPQENSAELDTDESNDGSHGQDESSSNETQRCSSSPEESDSTSSMEPEWTEDETTDGLKQEGDLCRVRRRTLCGTFGFRPPEQVSERHVV